MSYKLLGEGVMILEKSLYALREVEAIIFDCDGTIIDHTESYHLADKVTTCIILDRLYGLRALLGKDVDEALNKLSMLGGFNNDWHKTSLVIQAILLRAEDQVKRLREDLGLVNDVENYVERCLVEESSPEAVRAGVRWLSEKASENYGRFMKLSDFEEIIDSEAGKIGRDQLIRDLREVLGPLENYGSGLLTTLYDEIFLGEKGVSEKYGVHPKYVSWKGMLDREKILMSLETIEVLKRLAPRGLGIITGRGRWETERALGQLAEYFDLESSLFSADLPRELDKPEPSTLIECAKRLEAEKVAYVGDAYEDLLLVRKARERGLEAFFIGVLTNPYALDLFVKDQADALIDDVNLLPKVFERGETFWRPY